MLPFPAFDLFSPGVIITDVHKRAGLDEEQYAQVHAYKHIYAS